MVEGSTFRSLAMSFTGSRCWVLIRTSSICSWVGMVTLLRACLLWILWGLAVVRLACGAVFGWVQSACGGVVTVCLSGMACSGLVRVMVRFLRRCIEAQSRWRASLVAGCAAGEAVSASPDAGPWGEFFAGRRGRCVCCLPIFSPVEWLAGGLEEFQVAMRRVRSSKSRLFWMARWCMSAIWIP